MSSEAVQRRLAAILAADVVGYSRLMSADEAGTLAAVKACLELSHHESIVAERFGTLSEFRNMLGGNAAERTSEGYGGCGHQSSPLLDIKSGAAV